METISYYSELAALIVIVITWLIFFGSFFWGKRPDTSSESKRAPNSIFGIVLQGIAFGIVWAMQRRPFLSPFIPDHYVLGIAFAVAAIVLAVASLLFARAAIRELGKQWSIKARILEDHKLITTGAYNVVRHPIYATMFGMLLATAFVITHWIGAILAVVVFLVGTKIRTINEERLLSEAFGEEFYIWKKKVPSFIPFVNI